MNLVLPLAALLALTACTSEAKQPVYAYIPVAKNGAYETSLEKLLRYERKDTRQAQQGPDTAMSELDCYRLLLAVGDEKAITDSGEFLTSQERICQMRWMP